MGEDKNRLENLTESFAEYLAAEGREYVIFVSLNEEEKFISLRTDSAAALSVIYGLCESLDIPFAELPRLLLAIKSNEFIDLADVHESKIRKTKGGSSQKGD